MLKYKIGLWWSNGALMSYGILFMILFIEVKIHRGFYNLWISLLLSR